MASVCYALGQHLARLVFIILGASWLSGICHAQTKASDEWRRRFFDEAPLKWQEYIAFSDRLQGTGTRIDRDEKGATLYQTFGESKRNASCALVTQGVVDSDWEVTALNAAYTFRLHRQTSKEPWVIAGVTRRQPGLVNQDIRDTMDVWAHGKMLHLWHSCQLPDLARQNTFRVLQAAPVNRDGAELVRIEFDNRHPITDKPFFAVQWGVLLLDPARYWCLREGEVTCRHPNGDTETKVEIVSRDGPDRCPIPVRRVDTVVWKWADKAAEKSSYTADFQLQVPDLLPGDEEFTLTAFGFNEPPWLEQDRQKPTRWWLWGALTGGALLALGAIFNWLRQRAKS